MKLLLIFFLSLCSVGAEGQQSTWDYIAHLPKSSEQYKARAKHIEALHHALTTRVLTDRELNEVLSLGEEMYDRTGSNSGPNGSWETNELQVLRQFAAELQIQVEIRKLAAPAVRP